MGAYIIAGLSVVCSVWLAYDIGGVIYAHWRINKKLKKRREERVRHG